MAIDITKTLDRIEAILEATNGNTTLERVHRGEPFGLAPSSRPQGTFYLQSRGPSKQGSQTMGNRMASYGVRVEVWWPAFTAETVIRTVEAEIWSASRDIPGAFAGDSKLNATEETGVADLDVGPVTVEFRTVSGPAGAGGAWYRVLYFDLAIQDFEAEAISA